MNFLQKLLQGIAFVPAVVNSIEGLFGNRSGEEKKQSAVSFISAALQLTEAVANREIVDEVKVKSGLSKVIDGVIYCRKPNVVMRTRLAPAANITNGIAVIGPPPTNSASRAHAPGTKAPEPFTAKYTKIAAVNGNNIIVSTVRPSSASTGVRLRTKP